MDYTYSRQNIKGKEKLLERIFEIVPGGLSWLIIIGMASLLLFKPLAAMIIVIAFILDWLMRLMYMNVLLLLSYARFNIEKNTDWINRIEGVDRLESYFKGFRQKTDGENWYGRISKAIHISQLDNLIKSGSLPPKSEDIHHVVIIPVIKEGAEIVEPGIIAIEKGSYPSEKILLLIALEERASEDIKRQMHELREKHRENFRDFAIVPHPSDIPGEAAVKGANATFAAKKAADYLTEKAIPYENVIVSCFDADTVVVHDYFSCLTYYFMVTPNRIKASFQPIPVYFNNIWDAPSFARIIDIGISFFQLIEATDPKKLITFSSHSMSFKALSDIGYWPTDIISDDSAIFWKAFLHFDGDYQTIPMPITLSMDIVSGRNLAETIKNVYKQKRRWAWGVENFPIIMRGFLRTTTIPLYLKIIHTVRLLDNFISWATWSFLLTFISFIPLFFTPSEFADTTVYYIAPRMKTTVFLLSSFGLVICVIMSLLPVPPQKNKHSIRKMLQHAGEWLLIPVVVLFFSALPALDAQTRLMFGKYMEFWVTDKYRLKNTS